jgi:hypothetical protein
MKGKKKKKRWNIKKVNDTIRYLIENGIATDFKKMLKRSIKKSRAEKIGYPLEQADKLGRDDHERNEETRTHNKPISQTI